MPFHSLPSKTIPPTRSSALSRTAIVAIATIVCVLSIVGCERAAATPAAPAGGIVVMASGADLESANPLVTVHPLARQVQRFALFVTLVRYDDSLHAAPYFARRWTWSADRRVVTFALESSLRWHDGAPTTARDVAFTLEAARDPATGSPRASELAWIERVDVRDDSTVTLVSTRPLAALPNILCELPVVPEHVLRDVPRGDFRRDAFATAPVGNGPFVFRERRAGERWIFDRNEAFPPSMGGPPHLGRFIVAVVDEPTTKFAGLVSGDLDVAGISPTMTTLVARDPTLEVVSYPVSFSFGLVFNVARPPFDDPRVRHAVSAAIDRARIVRVALAGFGTPASGPVPPEHPFAAVGSDEPRTRDDSGAVRELDAAGWTRGADGIRSKGGTPLRFTLLTVGSGDNALEQLLQADLRLVGIGMEIRTMEFGAFLAEARATPKRFDALVTGIPGDLSLAHLAGMFDGLQKGGALDYSGYHDVALDSAFAAVRAAPDDSAERAAWIEIQRDLDRALPVAWLYHARGVQGMRRRLHGVHMDLRGELATLAAWRIGDTTPQ